MNDLEQMFLDKSKEDTFHNVMNDNFDFADSLIEPLDVERVEG